MQSHLSLMFVFLCPWDVYKNVLHVAIYLKHILFFQDKFNFDGLPPVEFIPKNHDLNVIVLPD